MSWPRHCDITVPSLYKPGQPHRCQCSRDGKRRSHERRWLPALCTCPAAAAGHRGCLVGHRPPGTAAAAGQGSEAATAPQGPGQRPTEEPSSPCGSQGLQASADPSEASGWSREPPERPLQLRPLRERGQGAAGADAAALGSAWDAGTALRRDVAGAVGTAGAAGEARPPALLCLVPPLRAPPALQEAAPAQNGHPCESLQPVKDIPSETGCPSKKLRPSETRHRSRSLHCL